jgi:hypothetical protein
MWKEDIYGILQDSHDIFNNRLRKISVGQFTVQLKITLSASPTEV